ncbi:uncharacterized protein LOC121381993 [Gigantopelta aegis]|uniref:uncharacterized protein LOC121381993 n=1 Tax=Gigantopelta aegis TaxID=1735272 RepID=UPI001B88C11B|nr:uncharacterized protein LOC121381993 [Gigantopelta aegis]
MFLQFVVYVSVFNLATAQLRWQRLHNGGLVNTPIHRRDHALGFDPERNQLILFGGRPGPLHDTWTFNITSASWRKVVSTVHPPGRFSSVSGVSNGYFYVTTGEGDGKRFLSDVWRFNLRTEVWEELPGQVKPDYVRARDWTKLSKQVLKPDGRYGAAGGIFPNTNNIFVSLGFATEDLFDTFTYNVHKKGWYREFCDNKLCNPYDPRYPHARFLHSGTVIENDQLIIFGGCLTAGPCPSGDSWLFDNKIKIWIQMDDCATPSIYSSMAALPTALGHRRVVLYGGIEHLGQVMHTTTILADQVTILNPDTGVWTSRRISGHGSSDNIPVRRASAAMVTGKHGIYMFGGEDLQKNEQLNDVWILRGDAASSDRSLALPCSKTFINYIAIHGILMAVGWGFFLQWGAFIARYLHTTSPAWFYVHVMMQIFGLCCALAGFIFAVLSVQFNHFVTVHSIVGLVTMILGILQPFNAIIRPHKLEMEQKTYRRRVWEAVHHFGGRSVLILALVNISLGVFIAVSIFLIWTLWFSYLAFLVGVYFLAEMLRGIRGRNRHTWTEVYSDNKTKDQVNGVSAEKEPPVDYMYDNTATEIVHL